MTLKNFSTTFREITDNLHSFIEIDECSHVFFVDDGKPVIIVIRNIIIIFSDCNVPDSKKLPGQNTTFAEMSEEFPLFAEKR